MLQLQGWKRWFLSFFVFKAKTCTGRIFCFYVFFDIIFFRINFALKLYGYYFLLYHNFIFNLYEFTLHLASVA